MIIENEKYNILGMHWAACSARVEKAIKSLAGVKDFSVNLLNNNMIISYDSSILDKDKIISCIVNEGYEANLAENGNPEKKK